MSKSSFKPGWRSQIFFYLGAFTIYLAYSTNEYITAILISLPFFLIAIWLYQEDKKQAMEDADEKAIWTLKNTLVSSQSSIDG